MESQAPVYGSPQVKTLLTVTKPTEITRIWTFHWNDGQGETPGTIGLRDVQRDRTLGTWPAVGTRVMFKTKPGVEWPTSGNGPPFRYWAATVGLVVPPGTYEVVDSSPQTWSTNGKWKQGMHLGVRPAVATARPALALGPHSGQEYPRAQARRW